MVGAVVDALQKFRDVGGDLIGLVIRQGDGAEDGQRQDDQPGGILQNVEDGHALGVGHGLGRHLGAIIPSGQIGEEDVQHVADAGLVEEGVQGAEGGPAEQGGHFVHQGPLAEVVVHVQLDQGDHVGQAVIGQIVDHGGKGALPEQVVDLVGVEGEVKVLVGVAVDGLQHGGDDQVALGQAADGLALHRLVQLGRGVDLPFQEEVGHVVGQRDEVGQFNGQQAVRDLLFPGHRLGNVHDGGGDLVEHRDQHHAAGDHAQVHRGGHDLPHRQIPHVLGQILEGQHGLVEVAVDDRHHVGHVDALQHGLGVKDDVVQGDVREQIAQLFGADPVVGELSGDEVDALQDVADIELVEDVIGLLQIAEGQIAHHGGQTGTEVVVDGQGQQVTQHLGVQGQADRPQGGCGIVVVQLEIDLGEELVCDLDSFGRHRRDLRNEQSQQTALGQVDDVLNGQPLDVGQGVGVQEGPVIIVGQIGIEHVQQGVDGDLIQRLVQAAQGGVPEQAGPFVDHDVRTDVVVQIGLDGHQDVADIDVLPLGGQVGKGQPAQHGVQLGLVDAEAGVFGGVVVHSLDHTQQRDLALDQGPDGDGLAVALEQVVQAVAVDLIQQAVGHEVGQAEQVVDPDVQQAVHGVAALQAVHEGLADVDVGGRHLVKAEVQAHAAGHPGQPDGLIDDLAHGQGAQQFGQLVGVDDVGIAVAVDDLDDLDDLHAAPLFLVDEVADALVGGEQGLDRIGDDAVGIFVDAVDQVVDVEVKVEVHIPQILHHGLAQQGAGVLLQFHALGVDVAEDGVDQGDQTEIEIGVGLDGVGQAEVEHGDQLVGQDPAQISRHIQNVVGHHQHAADLDVGQRRHGILQDQGIVDVVQQGGQRGGRLLAQPQPGAGGQGHGRKANRGVQHLVQSLLRQSLGQVVHADQVLVEVAVQHVEDLGHRDREHLGGGILDQGPHRGPGELIDDLGGEDVVVVHKGSQDGVESLQDPAHIPVVQLFLGGVDEAAHGHILEQLGQAVGLQRAAAQVVDGQRQIGQLEGAQQILDVEEVADLDALNGQEDRIGQFRKAVDQIQDVADVDLLVGVDQLADGLVAHDVADFLLEFLGGQSLHEVGGQHVLQVAPGHPGQLPHAQILQVLHGIVDDLPHGVGPEQIQHLLGEDGLIDHTLQQRIHALEDVGHVDVVQRPSGVVDQRAQRQLSALGGSQGVGEHQIEALAVDRLADELVDGL